MPYNSSTGLITAPLNTNDVCAALGITGVHDVGRLCTNKNINPAAIFRPRFTSHNPGLVLDAAGFDWIATQTGQAPDTSYASPGYGIWVPKYNISGTASSLYDNIFTQARKEWYIAAPDDRSFKCLHHFVGYFHGARIINPLISAAISKPSSGPRVVVTFTAPPADGKTVSVSNLFGSGDWYFGAVVFRGTNAEGWTTSDKMLAASASKTVQSCISQAVEVVIDDTDADPSSNYIYRVIPFVCNRKSLTTETLIDTEYYNLKLNADCKAYMELKANGSIGGGETSWYVNYFNWTERANGDFYPIPGDRSVRPTATKYDILVAYSEKFNYTDVQGATANSGLRDIYHRVDLEFSLYRWSDGKHIERTYTWLRDGGSHDNYAMQLETSIDPYNNPKDRLLFTLDGAVDMLNSVGDPSYIEVLGRFYYIDSKGYPRSGDHFATFIPDIVS